MLRGKLFAVGGGTAELRRPFVRFTPDRCSHVWTARRIDDAADADVRGIGFPS